MERYQGAGTMSDGRDFLVNRVTTHLEEMAHLAGSSSEGVLTPHVIALEALNALVGSVQHWFAQVETLDVFGFGEFSAQPPKCLALTIDSEHWASLAALRPPNASRIANSLDPDFWTIALPKNGVVESSACDTIIEEIVAITYPAPRRVGEPWINTTAHVVVVGLLDLLLAAFALRVAVNIKGLGRFAYVDRGKVDCVADEAIVNAVNLRRLRQNGPDFRSSNLEYTAGSDSSGAEPPGKDDASVSSLERRLSAKGLAHRVAKQYADLIFRHRKSVS